MAVVPPPPSLDNIVCSEPTVSEILDDDIDDVYYFFLVNNKWPLPDDVTINLWRAVFKKWATDKHNNGVFFEG